MFRSFCLCAATLGFAASVMSQPLAPSPAWDVYADTWVATGGVGRTLPTQAQVGNPRANRQVGIFYFLWLGRTEPDSGPFNITQILQKNPNALERGNDRSLWGGLYSFHHWNEPLWGYYNRVDLAIIRKHAEQLSAAGVDMLLFDASNPYVYPEVVKALTKVFLQMQREGQRVPLLAFHTVAASGPEQITEVKTIYNNFYKPGKNDSLWFKWNGKPLIIADPDQKFAPGISDYFSFRKTYWGSMHPGPGSWDSDFSFNGDAAPNDRFNYRALFPS